MPDNIPTTIESYSGESLLTTPSGGSTFILNNTSYSGADIKVVVHIYERGRVAKEKAKELEDEAKKTDEQILEINGELSAADELLGESYHRDTPEYQGLISHMNKLYAEKERLQQSTIGLREEAKQLRKGLSLASTKTLAEVQTLSTSIHRVKRPVRAFGKTYATGYTRGSRTIAGSMIFTVFNEHVLYQFLEAHASDFDATSYTSALLDQLPPVDITVAFANEYGAVSRMTIIGVEFQDEGQIMSIEDILTENTVSFVARDIDPMRSVGQRKIDENSRLTNDFHMQKASDLIAEDEYQNVKNILDPFERFRRRHNTFV